MVRASIGLKAAMAVSGALMALWVTIHALAIQLVFLGPELMNGYALKLRATGLLWPMRAGLLALLIVHVVAAMVTSGRSWSARPVAYAHRARSLSASFASRSMRTGGALLLLYVVYHVAQIYGVGHAAFVPEDVHHNLVAILEAPVHAFVYAAASWVICLHLAHGLESALRSIGRFEPRDERRASRYLRAWAYAVGVLYAVPSIYFQLAS